MKDGVPVTTPEPVKDGAGIIVRDKMGNPVMQPAKAYSFGRFMCFDYVQLSQRYGLRLESFSATEADRIEQEEEENDTPTYKEAEIF